MSLDSLGQRVYIYIYIYMYIYVLCMYVYMYICIYVYIYNAADGLAAGGCREFRFFVFAAHTRLLLAL
jgi:hypothetical protein